MIGQYAHGNEPSHANAWLYHYAGRPGASAARVSRILGELYGDTPDGLSGNEDCGQMSSWYVMSAIGLYPACPCSDEYLVGVPLFDRVTLHLDDGRDFVIRAPGATGPGGPRFVASARLGGAPLARSYLRHGEIVGGGRLDLTLGAEPGERWGVAPEDRPRSRAGGERVLAAPFARAASDTFGERLTVALDDAEPGASIRFAPEAGMPREDWPIYREPLVLTAGARLRFVASKGDLSSPVVEAMFHRIPNDWKVSVAGVPNPQYTAGGPEALIDGLRGTDDWRTGGWQGYQYADFEATVDLGRERVVHRAGAGFLQDIGSWIWMPGRVTVSVSADGRAYREAGWTESGVADDERGVIRAALLVPVDGAAVRYVRIRARNYGAIPAWHPGHGDGAFIFVDEILID